MSEPVEQNQGREFKRKNDYSVAVYNGSAKGPTIPHVHKISKLTAWLEEKKIPWSVINVYSKRSGVFLRRYYKGDPIPDRVPDT